MKNKIILISSIAFFLITCRNDKGQIPVPIDQTGDFCSKTPHSFTDVVAPIITTYCATQTACHGPGRTTALIPFDNYTDINIDLQNATGQGSIRDRVLGPTSLPMPPSNGVPLPASQLAILKCWLDEGAPNSGPAPAACSTTISYSSTIAPAIATTYSCSKSGCHNASSVYGDFTTYSGVHANTGKLDTIVVLKQSISFPYNKHDSVIQTMTAGDISNIDCWIKQGALNN